MTLRSLSWTDRLVFGGAGVSLLVAPTQWSLEIWPDFHLSLVDPLLGLTVLLWLATVLRAHRWRALLPPGSLIVLLALAGASIFVAEDKPSAFKNGIQFLLFFGAGFLVWRDLVRRFPRQAPRIGVLILSAGLLVNLVLAVFQYFDPDLDSFMVRGAFLNRNVYGGYLSLAAAFALATLAHRGVWWQRILAALALAAIFLTLLSGAAFLAIGLSAGVGFLAIRGRYFVALGAVLLAMLVWVLPNLPRYNEEALIESIALYEPATGQPARRYPEWQAATIMTLEHPWLGVGIGNYQRNVNQYYVLVPNRTGATEPDTQNLYLVLSSSLGLPALLAFLAFTIGGVLRATRAYSGLPPGDWRRTACWAAATGIAGWMICALGSPLLVRGLFPLLSAWLAFAYAAFDNRVSQSPHSGA